MVVFFELKMKVSSHQVKTSPPPNRLHHIVDIQLPADILPMRTNGVDGDE
jgi:hypothetical protein